MQLVLDEEQRLLRDSVERFVRERYPFERRRAVLASEDGFDRDAWATMAELGWLGIGTPEEHGGIGGGPLETMVVMRGIGRGLVLEPFLASVVLAGTCVREAGSPAQRDALLAPLAAGERILTLAWVEPQSGYDLFDVETRATRDGAGWRLDGHKGVVLHAAAADRIVVTARTAGDGRDREGIGLFVVERDAPGLSRRDYANQDGQRASELAFDGVRVDDDSVLGPPGGALPAIERAAGHGIAALCAEAVGCLDAVVESTNEYLKTREQFGRPIGSFQVLQHRMVDLFIAREECESMSVVAAQALSLADPEARERALAGAKTLIGQRGLAAGEDSIQLHGGMGMTEEMAIGHHFKRLAMIDVMLGDHRHHLDRIALA